MAPGAAEWLRLRPCRQYRSLTAQLRHGRSTRLGHKRLPSSVGGDARAKESCGAGSMSDASIAETHEE
jgi:hypothetical protein